MHTGLQLILVLFAALNASCQSVAEQNQMYPYTMKIPANATRSLPSPDARGILLADKGVLSLSEGKRKRVVLRYSRTLTLGWSPDGEHFFVNDETSSDRTELYVIDRRLGLKKALRGAILKADPELRQFANAGSHMYISATRWTDNRTLEVQVSGHTDSPVEEFDHKLQVTTDGAVTAL